jgi:hypothetical protein
MNKHEEYILNILKKKDKKGNVIARESSEIEFKESFNFSNITEYSKYMASFANKSGGYIIFGIKDNPRKIVGINPDRFNEISQEKITSFLLEHFNPEIKWDIGIVEYDTQSVGYIYTYKAENKPVICKKNKDGIIKNGEIYYRYRAQTRNIEYGELTEIIDEIKEKEKQNWIRLLTDIASIGPENVIVSKKSGIEMRPSSSPKALPVNIEEKNLRELYPYDYRQLTAELKKRYTDFKENKNYHNIRKNLKLQKEFCYTKILDPNHPKSPKKDFYSKEIIKEFDKYYTLKK